MLNGFKTSFSKQAFKSGVEEQLSFRQKKAATQEVAEARDQNNRARTTTLATAIAMLPVHTQTRYEVKVRKKVKFSTLAAPSV
ncbi:hypothetical protein HZU72_20385 [Halomonas sp. QX-2]|uniref:Uncharacterized protein n=1 Tax=Vreelandella sedimenti TaxID=2729618 RepID=A0A7Z0SPX3_9GAMM|nr:hypothetical protein [Halomonas sedimenti]